ncbi:MAG: Tad domain-containing protein, partial [Selenomonadaceae bacterium]|nr:Tad domain-containing protein [Selenomonadaceae bacterium]
MLRRIRGLFGSEHGAAIVLTAFMLPTILCLTGLSVDVGRVYVAKSNLQNAADASALAGGHMYAGTNRNNAQTIDCVQSYTGKNIRNKAIAEGADTPADEDTVNVDTRIANDNVDVYLRQRVPTVFLGAVGSLLHIGDYETLSVTAASRAHVAATGGTENNGFFDYTIFGAATTRWTKNDERGNSAHKQYKISGLTKDDMQPDNNPELASVTFKGNPHNPYKITGNIGSNGR